LTRNPLDTPSFGDLMSSWASLPGLLLVAAGLLEVAGTAHAQTFTWNKDASDSWTTAANWTPNGIPDGQGFNVVFGNSITANRTVSLDSNVTVGSISFENTAFSYTVGGTGSLTLDNGANPAQISLTSTVLAGQTITRQLIAASDINIVNNSLSGPLTLSGGVNLGGRTLTLSGVGNVNFSNNPIIGSAGSRLVLNGPGAAYLQAGNTGLKYEVNGGILVAFVNNALQPLQAGTLTPDLLTLSNGGTVNFHVQQTQADFIGITLGTGGGRIDSDATSPIVLSAPITGGGSLTKIGTQTVALAAANTYTGETIVRQGTLRIDVNAPNGAAGALGNAASAVILGDNVGANSTALFIGVNNVTVGRDVTVVASPAPGASTVTIGSRGAAFDTVNGAFTGTLTLNRSVVLDTRGVVTFGRITGAGGITVAGTGTAALTSSASDFTGTINLDSAALSISADAQLGAATNDLVIRVGTLRVTGSTPFGTGRPITLLNGGASYAKFDVQNTDTASGFTIHSAITGNGPFSKRGPGILTFAGANTFGTTTHVEQGTLSAAAANVLSPNSTLAVYSGATVRLNGFSQQVERIMHGPPTSYGTIDLGSNPAAVLTVGNNGVAKQPISFEGQIIGQGQLVFTGIGSQWMGGTSSFVGTTTVRQGILELRDPVPASGNGPLGHSSGGAIRLGDANFAAFDAMITSTDKSSAGFSRPITVVAGPGKRSIGHRLFGTTHATSTVTFSGPIALEKDLHLYSISDASRGNAVLRVAGVISGSSGLVKIGGEDAFLTADNTYTGLTTVNNGRLVIGGAGAPNGAARTSSGFMVRSDWRDLGPGLDTAQSPPPSDTNYAELAIQDNSPNPDRIGNVDVTLFNGRLTYNGRAGGASSESFGSLVLDRGLNHLAVTVGDTAAGTSASLSMTGGFTRTNGSTLVVSAPTSLGGPDGQNYARVLAASAPTLVGGGGAAGSTNISIIPWAYHDPLPDGGSPPPNDTFLTYGATGLRPLLGAEYAASLTAAGSLNNVRLTSTSATLTQDQTINSLLYDQTADGTIDLAGRKLTVNSGAILSAAADRTLTINGGTGGELAFGGAEAVFHAPYQYANRVVVNSVVSGSGGLVVNVGGAVALNGVNAYTGPTTINSGGVEFNSAASFGAGGGPIRFRNVINSSMSYTGAGATTLSNPIELSSGSTPFLYANYGRITFSVTNGGTLTLSGVIGGIDAGPVLAPVFDARAGVIELRGASTFNAFHVEMRSGAVGINSDGNFGAATNPLRLGGGTTNTPTLRFDAAGITVARPVVFTGHAVINTNGHDGTISGPMTGGNYTSILTKSGAGVLTLSGANNFPLTIQVAGGTLRVNSTLGNPFPSGLVHVLNGGTLGGSGSIQRLVRVHSGGTLAPGAGPGTLTLGALEFVSSASANYDWEAGASSQDQVVVTSGPVNLTGISTTLRLHDRGLGTSVTPGQQFPLYVVAGANSITGFDPTKFTVDFTDAPNWVAGQYTLALGASGGNTVLYLTNIAPVPEPAGLLAVAGATLAVAGWRRRHASCITS
jgi:fibronectin-binding autotransporter adhesin